jgi:predicted membrane protein
MPAFRKGLGAVMWWLCAVVAGVIIGSLWGLGPALMAALVPVVVIAILALIGEYP